MKTKTKAKLLSMLVAGSVSISANASLDSELELELFDTGTSVEESVELEELMHSGLGKPGSELRHKKLAKRNMMLRFKQRKRLRMLKKRSRRICKKAGLSFDEARALRKAMIEQKVANKPLKKELKSARKAFVAATLSDHANIAEIEESAVELAQARASLIASNKAFTGITVNELFEGEKKRKGLRCVASKMKIQKVKARMNKKNKRQKRRGVI